MDDFGAVALAGVPTEPKVGEPSEKLPRNATLVELVKEVRNKVGQNDSQGQRGQGCRQLGVVSQWVMLRPSAPRLDSQIITTTSDYNCFLCVLATPCCSAFCVQARKTPIRRAAQASRIIYLRVIRKPYTPPLHILPFHRAAQSSKEKVHPTG